MLVRDYCTSKISSIAPDTSAREAAEMMHRDAVGGTLYSGTSDIQRMIIARYLGL